MRFRKEATGTDMFPNKGFWMEIPGLIKDGCRFCVDKVLRRDGHYQKL